MNTSLNMTRLSEHFGKDAQTESVLHLRGNDISRFCHAADW
jgi:hypothetical protein